MKPGNLLAWGLASLLFSPSAWALVGGPWDHLVSSGFNRYNNNGLYEASISLKNGVGFMKFTVNSGQNTLESSDALLNQIQAALLTGGQGNVQVNSFTNLAANSNTIVYYRGAAYIGNVFGTVNNRFKIVTGVGSGQSALLDQIQRSITNMGGQGGGGGQQLFVNLAGFAETMNLSFNGKLTQEVPEMRFEAKGEVQFFNRPELEVNNILGGNLTEIRLANAGAGGFLDPVDKQPIRVFGGRISLETNFSPDFSSIAGGGGGGAAP